MLLNNVGGFYGNHPMWGQTILGNQTPYVGHNPMWGQTILGNQTPYVHGWNQIPVQLCGYGNTVPFTGQPMLNAPFGTQQIPGFNIGAQQIGSFNNGIVPNYNTAPFTNPFQGHTALQTQTIGRGVMPPFIGNFGNPFIGCY